ncbi:hypothetical protein Phou_100180 [Phytohabitans houttuyneae]|uniref:Uncharacterized protein n=1 Tax=Phytohabitans houttuyneae TaxID=1076126 RepID=A0A6V8KT60_9ACTN|nr:hypothetical protein Phou_100180 [Phytohabitans houttuyneae]
MPDPDQVMGVDHQTSSVAVVAEHVDVRRHAVAGLDMRAHARTCQSPASSEQAGLMYVSALAVWSED